MTTFNNQYFGDINPTNAKTILGSLLSNGTHNNKKVDDAIIDNFVSECIYYRAVTQDWVDQKKSFGKATSFNEKIDVAVKDSNVLFDVELTTRYANKAKNTIERGITWSLTFAQYKKLIKAKRCYYTGVDFEDTGDNSKTIDRIDNTVGYTVENCVMCTSRINQLKSALFENPSSVVKTTPTELLKIITKLMDV